MTLKEKLSLLDLLLFAKGLVAEDNARSPQREDIPRLEIAPFPGSEELSGDEGTYSAIVILKGEAEKARLPLRDLQQGMVTIHTGVSGDDRDIGLRVLITPTDTLRAEIEWEALLVAKGILHHRQRAYTRACLHGLCLRLGRLEAEIKLVSAGGTDERKALFPRGLQLFQPISGQGNSRVALRTKDLLHDGDFT